MIFVLKRWTFEAEIIIGLTDTKTMLKNILQVTCIAAKVSIKTGPMFFFRAQTCKINVFP